MLKISSMSSVESNLAHIIVFGNEKGGSGKSTTAMHVAIGLLRLGYTVATFDLDARQGSLTRYLANRFEYVAREKEDLPSPIHFPIDKALDDSAADQQMKDRAYLTSALTEIKNHVDFIVIDTPGADTFLSQFAHAQADTIFTPMNDSLIDLDVLARIDTATMEIKGPSIYTKLVQNSRLTKLGVENKDIDWIVMRNRLSPNTSANKDSIAKLLDQMAEKFDFRLAPGFSERELFRELYLKGLTLLDLKQENSSDMTMSMLAARQEMRLLLRCIMPEKHKGYPQKKKQG